MNTFERAIHHIGKHSKHVRYYYYKLSRGRWLWGIFGYIRDNPEHLASDNTTISEADFNEYMNKIFSYTPQFGNLLELRKNQEVK